MGEAAWVAGGPRAPQEVHTGGSEVRGRGRRPCSGARTHACVNETASDGLDST